MQPFLCVHCKDRCLPNIHFQYIQSETSPKYHKLVLFIHLCNNLKNKEVTLTGDGPSCQGNPR